MIRPPIEIWCNPKASIKNLSPLDQNTFQDNFVIKNLNYLNRGLCHILSAFARPYRYLSRISAEGHLRLTNGHFKHLLRNNWTLLPTYSSLPLGAWNLHHLIFCNVRVIVAFEIYYIFCGVIPIKWAITPSKKSYRK